MDFSHTTLAEQSFSGLTRELGEAARQHRNNIHSQTAIAGMLFPCRSTTSDIDIDSRDDRMGPLKLARTDSFTDLKLHESLGSLVRSNSMLSDGRLGCSPTNSNTSDISEAKLIRNDTLISYPFRSSGIPLHYGLIAQNDRANSGPFTASQIRELQHQALIFKYIRNGQYVPMDLLLPIRNSFLGLSSMMPGASQLPNMGWGNFHLGFANNIDPEPGRCRRTDGKKWRCSRDVVPDQKYCERHMHRGRHRAKKTAENTQNNSSQLHVPTTASSSNSTASPSLTGPALSNGLHPSIILNKPQNRLPSNLGLESFSSTNSPTVTSEGITLSSSLAPSHFQLPFETVSGSSGLSAKDYRYLEGVAKADIDVGLQQMFSDSSRGFLPESSTMNGLQMMNNSWQTSVQSKQQQHQLFEGSRFGVNVESLSMGRESEGQPLRHFFDDWPRHRDGAAFSWSDVEDDRSNRNSSTTQLSISIPMASSDFTASNTSSPRGKLPLSSLKLSMCRPGDDEQLGMRLGMNDDAHHQTNWNPISWESSVAGPLGEVLQSTNSTPRGCKSSGLNLMDDGWDNSPQHDSPPLALPADKGGASIEASKTVD